MKKKKYQKNLEDEGLCQMNIINKIRRSYADLSKRVSELLLSSKGVLTNSSLNSGLVQKGVIVSLTTFNQRIDKVHLTIESILQQTTRPEKIILWLYSGEINKHNLNYYLKRQIKQGLEVRYIDENLKSYKKLIYTLNSYPSYKIVTVDDDIIYPSYWLKELLRKSNEFPKSVVCYRSKYLELDARSAIKPYKELSYSKGGTTPSFALLPIGCSGILYPAESLHWLTTDSTVFTEICPNADDIWFKFMSLLNGVKCVKVQNESVHFKTIYNSQVVSLHRANNVEQLKKHESLNDIRINDMHNYLLVNFQLDIKKHLDY